MTLGGRYELKELLGRGGMGEVWLARDLSLLRRDVAVKVLSSLGGASAVRRFQREAAILAGLQHPGITVVHDAGEHDGFLFIVMELLRGRDLGHVLAERGGPLPVERAVDVARQTAVALAAAHGRGVVHRDLKPGNLFVQPGDEMKICDFGIALTADASAALTTAGSVLGTPLYMAPEQWRGTGVDARADLYSLGCILYEMLTGRAPFAAAGSVYALLHQHVEDAPAPPRELRPELPTYLDDLVLTLLAKDPAARPDARVVAHELAGVQADERSSSGPPAESATPRRSRGRGPRLEPSFTLSGHRRNVSSLDFSPDGGTLASGSWDKFVRLWDPRTGEPKPPLPMGSTMPAAVAFSGDGSTIATGCGKNIVLWDAASREQRLTVKYTGWVTGVHCVAFSPDGAVLATGGSGGIRLWDARTGAPGHVMKWGSGSVSAMAFSPDGRDIVGGGDSRTTRLWHVPTGQQRWKLTRNPYTSLVFSPDGETLATAPGDQAVHLKNARTGEDLRLLEGQPEGRTAMAFAPDGHTLATGGYDGVICLWDPATGDQRLALDGHTGPIHTLAFSPDGRTLASGGVDRVIRLWDVLIE